MMKHRAKTILIALATICAVSVIRPTTSYAALIDIACDALWRTCLAKCNSQACTDKCDNRRSECVLGTTTKKQQTPPPPCTGIRCTLRNPHPPTTVGPPIRKPRPIEPVKPVDVSNPNKTGAGNSAPVILYRKNNYSGGQGKRLRP